MKIAIFALVCMLFPVSHIVLSHGKIRASLIDKMGRWAFRGAYSAISFLTLGLAIWFFNNNRQLGPQLWELPRWLELTIAIPLMFFAFQLFALMLAQPSPSGMMPAKKEIRGVLRITRHPMNMAFALFGLTHIVISPYLGNVFFFGAFFILGLFGAFHQDARLANERSANYEIFRRNTSVLPFVAILRGRTKFEASELSFPMVIIGLALFASFVFLHGRLFGIDLF